MNFFLKGFAGFLLVLLVGFVLEHEVIAAILFLLCLTAFDT